MLPTAYVDREDADVDTFRVLEKPPTEYLLNANGDLQKAIADSGVSRGDFLRALGEDRSSKEVARSFSFLTMLANYQIMHLAAEGIEGHFYAASADPNDPDEAPAPSLPLKDLMALLRISSDFVITAASLHNPSALSPSRFTPPQSERSKVIQASRGRPSAVEAADTPGPDPDPDSNPTAEQAVAAVQGMIAFEDKLRERMRDAPEPMRAIFARLAASMAANPDAEAHK